MLNIMITKNKYYYGHQSEERINITARKYKKSDKRTIKIGKERKIYTGKNRRENASMENLRDKRI